MIITYKELSSLTTDLGYSAKALYYASNNIHKNYHKTKILKNTGGYRELSVPDDFLKAIQRSVVKNLLVHEEISPYATAYRYGGSIIKNARVHIGKEVLLKLDIKNFFDNVIYHLVKEKAFPKERYSESNRILLTMLCMYNDSLPQGAPTSPYISNIIMRDFDNYVGSWCDEHEISYTRYCDDMTFSGSFNPKEVIQLVKTELKKLGFFLNDKKTTIVKNGQKKVVTGIVVNEKLNVPIPYRKKIRQEIYYCKKFGVAEHLKYVNSDLNEINYLHKLLGEINYILSVDSSNKEMRECKVWVNDQIKKVWSKQESSFTGN